MVCATSATANMRPRPGTSIGKVEGVEDCILGVEGLFEPELGLLAALRHKMATEFRARGVSREELAYQMGHKLPDLRTTDRYTKFDKRYLATATATIEQYARDLNKLTKRALKILPTRVSATMLKKPEIPLGRMVGATRIELVTPTMST